MTAPTVFTVLADYEVHDPHPLRLPRGAEVRIIRGDTTWPGWLWVESTDQKGWLPESFLAIEEGAAQAILEAAFDGTELSARRGTTLTALSHAPGWIFARHPDGHTGWFPLFNLRPFPDI
ncbi:MAG: hypothetical protein RL648_1394 [Verrucomicrobiota bacterium]|jgi:hypothetical protein